MKAELVLTRQQIEGPCVYQFWLTDVCVYVGSSAVGLFRPLNPSHHVREHESFDYDRVEIFKQETLEDALRIEEFMINKLQPKLNVIFKSTNTNPSAKNENGKFIKSSWRNSVQKSRDKATGEFLVVRDSGEVLFRSREKFEQSRFLMQERRRLSSARKTTK